MALQIQNSCTISSLKAPLSSMKAEFNAVLCRVNQAQESAATLCGVHEHDTGSATGCFGCHWGASVPLSATFGPRATVARCYWRYQARFKT
jgi:hypothetical protein